MFFSYLPSDAAILRERWPENPKSLQWEAWIDDNFPSLAQTIMDEQSAVSMGMMVVTCDA
jgi:hypothetical protein